MPASRARKMGKKARQRRVEQFLAMGVRSQRYIAEQLGVHPGTICKDLKEIEQAWAEEAKDENKDKWKIRHHRMLDDMLATVWPAARGQGPLLPGSDPPTRIPLTLRETIAAQKAVLALLEERSKLEGMYAPLKFDGGLSTDEVRAMMLTQIAENEEALEDPLAGLTLEKTGSE